MASAELLGLRAHFFPDPIHLKAPGNACVHPRWAEVGSQTLVHSHLYEQFAYDVGPDYAGEHGWCLRVGDQVVLCKDGRTHCLGTTPNGVVMHIPAHRLTHQVGKVTSLACDSGTEVVVLWQDGAETINHKCGKGYACYELLYAAVPQH